MLHGETPYMKKLCLLVLLVSLAACQTARSPFGMTPSIPSSQDSHVATMVRAVPALGSDCSGGDVDFSGRGGRVSFPTVDGNFSSAVDYASANGGGGAVVYACPGTDNSFGMPVPKGHTPDWFGEVRFAFSAVYAQADLYGKMSAPVWLPKTSYFMYLYDGHYHHVGSYKIGRANVKTSVLKFPSPFENGLATPADGILYLEVAHRSE
jgi:hypothetical protein